MQLKFSLILLLITINAVRISAQQTNPVTLQNLLSDNKPISFIKGENIKYVSIKDTPVGSFPQQLIKTSKGLFIYPNGSGRSYQVLNNNGTIEFKRIDSTVFFGYSLGSFPFSYHDTIYSLGGYGNLAHKRTTENVC
jgi:hypothetical protein